MTRFAMSRITTVAAWLCLAVCTAGGAEPSKQADTLIRSLWIGSSSTTFHDMPEQVAEWATEPLGKKVVAETAGKGGMGIHEYLKQGFTASWGLDPGETILGKISKERFNAVVLQIPAEWLGGNDEFSRAIDTYCEAIRAAGGRPVLYGMGWKSNDENSAIGEKMAYDAAARNSCSIAPCRTAWRQVWQERPDLNLLFDDGMHPGELGLYLNMCCFYATLTGKSPVGLPNDIRIWRRLSDKAQQQAGRKYEEVAYAVPEQLASYLQKVAWKCSQDAKQRLESP